MVCEITLQLSPPSSVIFFNKAELGVKMVRIVKINLDEQVPRDPTPTEDPKRNSLGEHILISPPNLPDLESRSIKYFTLAGVGSAILVASGAGAITLAMSPFAAGLAPMIAIAIVVTLVGLATLGLIAQVIGLSRAYETEKQIDLEKLPDTIKSKIQKFNTSVQDSYSNLENTVKVTKRLLNASRIFTQKDIFIHGVTSGEYKGENKSEADIIKRIIDFIETNENSKNYINEPKKHSIPKELVIFLLDLKEEIPDIFLDSGAKSLVKQGAINSSIENRKKNKKDNEAEISKMERRFKTTIDGLVKEFKSKVEDLYERRKIGADQIEKVAKNLNDVNNEFLPQVNLVSSRFGTRGSNNTALSYDFKQILNYFFSIENLGLDS